MGEIAAVFHWPLSELDALSIEELFDWRDRAVRIWNQMQGKEAEE
ncbi:GpE family phage tail protein [Novosphingobium clariflavum]|uniref:GpE family phage tail protein n=1 Tax=Novosphingobium clariflavum TaxID=2029884 RepID=A0ABV6S2V2_9SPHN|nr:GpE family phage tail protein [Novosphingobium clariflavum]